MNRGKLNLNEEAVRKMLQEEGYGDSPEEIELLMKTMKQLWGKDKPMGHNTMNNPDVYDNYMKAWGYSVPTREEYSKEELQEQMNMAVEAEDYMEAARLRDIINS